MSNGKRNSGNRIAIERALALAALTEIRYSVESFGVKAAVTRIKRTIDSLDEMLGMMKVGRG